MPDSIQPRRLARGWRARLAAAALLPVVVLAAGCTGSSHPTARTAKASGAATPAGVVSDCLIPFPGSCYAPRLFRVAYGIQPLLDKGIDGRGETVTVLAAAPPPNAPGPAASAGALPSGPLAATTDIRSDLTAFDAEFGLPAARIQVVTGLDGAAAGGQATGQEVQAAEIVHAVAPAAALRVVLLPADVLGSAATATAAMLAGVRRAVTGTDVAAVSFSLGEHYFSRAQVTQLHATLMGASAHHVTVVAGTGDSGAFSDDWFGGPPVKEVSLPAADPLVLAVGGTTLNADPANGAYLSETTWNGQGGVVVSKGASAGGFSHLYARPAYQDGVAGTTSMRGVPDVAGDAFPDGPAVVLVSGGKRWIAPATGTGAAAALWAGVMALADQDARHDLGFVNPAIYRIARGSGYHQALHDVTTGTNVQDQLYPAVTAGYRAGAGWDPVTGWGSPDAQALVSRLAG